MATKEDIVVSKVRIIHYMNQFFAGIGGEDKADVPVGSCEGAVGPGKRLQTSFGDSAEIVVTAYCGDNYFAEHTNEALESILQIARDQNVKLLVAGPAFASGRHGFACAEVCHFLSTTLSLECVTGMHPENPGIESYRQYKDKRVFAFPTTEVVSGMEEALSKMAQFVLELSAGSTIGTAAEAGYIPRGLRLEEFVSKNAAERTIDMLLDKIAGQPFTTEIPIEQLKPVPVASRITSIADTCLALATTAGVLPEGNPDGFKVWKNTQWRKYSIGKLDTMKDTGWDAIHGGYNNVFMQENPNYGVPLDVCREMEREGVFAKLYPYFYMTNGVLALMPEMQRIGREMAIDMKAQGVNAALLTST